MPNGTARLLLVIDMYERISDQLISTKRFVWRLVRHGLYIISILTLSALVGAAGFMLLVGYGFQDALLHATHILAGLGIIQLPESYAGRLFVVLFGLYASLFFIAAFSIISAPVIHRVLHKLHLDDAS